MDRSSLKSIGWNETLESAFDRLGDSLQDLVPGRVAGQGKGHYQILVQPDQSVKSAVAGSFHNKSVESAGFPTVGDWVALARSSGQFEATITHVLPRGSLIQRRRSGRRADRDEMQLIAANVDHMLIVTSMNEDFDLPRLERYVSLANDSGCAVAIVLTKSDLVSDPSDYLRQTKAKFATCEVLAISQSDPKSLEAIQRYFTLGSTSVLVGSSGVGKSTLTNYLLGFEAQKTQGLSAESRGKHTTTTRDLRITRFGGLVIDTPGMQEIADQTKTEDVGKDFSDVEELELQCKFSNCQHGKAPGCAVTRAIKDGEIDAERVATFLARRLASASRGKGRSR